MRILAATWGNPWRVYNRGEGCFKEEYGWREVTYTISKSESCACKLRARSSLPLLHEYIDPNRTILIVVDTTAEAKNAKEYNQIIDNIKHRYINFIEKELGIDSKKITLIVAPGVGEYPNGTFIGSMRDFYIYILYKLTREISKHIPTTETIEIHLDLTHGINYMPTLTYRALRELAEIIALRSNVRLVVYNSEPYVGDVKVEKLNIHVVEDSHIPPSPCRELLSTTTKLRLLEAIENTKTSIELDGKQKKIWEKYRDHIGSLDEINAFIGAIAGGLPLAVYTFYPNTEKLREMLEEINNMYKEYIKVSVEDGRVEIVKNATFTTDYAVLSKTLLTAKLLNIKRKSEAYLQELETLREEIFHKSKRLNIMISRDLNEIREKIRELVCAGKYQALTEWVALKNILGLEGGYETRNYILHSGLECNVTEVKLEDSVKLRYKGSELERVKRDSIKAL